MLIIVILNCVLLVLLELTNADDKDNDNQSDVKRITITNLAGDYSDNPGKEIVLEGNSNEKAFVFPKKSLFSKRFKVTECTGYRCTSEQLSNEERIKMNKCNFEGNLLSDPESKVSVVGCKGNGGKDISIVSEKTNLTQNIYRINSNGEIEDPPISNFSDVLEKGKYEDDDDFIDIGGHGDDYSDDVVEFHMFFDKKQFAVTVKDVNSTCCRPIRTQCKELPGKVKRCTVQKGKILCEKGEQTCLALKDYVKKKSENQQKKNIMENKKEVPKKDENASIIGNGEEVFDEEDYDSAYGSSKEKNDKQKYLKSKQIKDLTKFELVKLIKELNAPQENEKTNPKCSVKKNLFRSTQFISTRCIGRSCRKKDPVPKQKVYLKRTVEIGVFIDKHLHQRMSEDIRSSDNEKIKKAIVEMVHGMFVEIENFLTHKTFTTLEGGFKIAINGVHIYKEHGDAATRKWDKQKSVDKLIYAFKEFAMKVNGACDANENSYDAMILLTGRDDFEDVRPGLSVGYAFTGEVCKIAPVLVMMLRLDGKGSHEQVCSQLLSHELGHLFGSEHDNRPASSKNSIYWELDAVPCPENVYMMSPTVGSDMNTWSKCTQKMIDAEYQRREELGLNCFYT